MRRDEALMKLRSLEPYLRARGLAQVYLFGSVSRDEAGPSSDVDVAFDIVPGADFDAFDMGGIYLDLVDALGAKVDFVERRILLNGKDFGVEKDLIRVF
jgi:predicted nucleotidyltransferase